MSVGEESFPSESPRWRFDHLGLVVKSLSAGRRGIGGALGIARWTREVEDPINGVRIQFGHDRAGVVYELLEPLGETSPVYPALKSGKAILNHVAYLVPRLEDAAEIMRSGRAGPVSEPKPAIAYGGARIQFFVTSVKMIVELIEVPEHQHQFSVPTS